MDQPMNQTAENTPDLTRYRERYSEYARRLLSDLGLGDVPNPERGQLLAAIEGYVNQVLTNTLLENLDDTHLAQVEAMQERGAGQDELVAYLVTNIPEFDTKVARSLESTYGQLLEETRALAQAVAGQHVSAPETQDQEKPVT